MSAELEATDPGAEYYYLKFALRIAIQLLLLMYLLKPRVLAYFGLEDLHKAKAIGKLVGTVGIIFGLATAVSVFS
ncbi:hypothetical protein [Rubinisphaera sp. JC750]|uniref:hypothetical protein n=1 Tax=Rubinisphaera sp. JC750 TaxID=2898658 RepID=UPI001F199BF4|nr:hypothetical protein [Rubinisphaera sp. JC750]